MKKLVIGSVLALLPAAAAFGKGPRSRSLVFPIPAAAVRAAAESLGPVSYPFDGVLECRMIEQDIMPPYTPASTCRLTVFDYKTRTEKVAEVESRQDMIEAIVQRAPRPAPMFTVKGFVFVRDAGAEAAELTIPDAR